MCQQSEAKSIEPRRQRPRQEHPPTTTAAVPTKPMKRTHLLTDEGFLPRLGANLAVLSALLVAIAAHPRATAAFLDVYHATKERLMDLSGSMAWWSLLALLSSSCCAVQILLNSLSLGCAGFNTVLGPLRPTFMAVMIVAQVGSWYAAYYYAEYARGQSEQSWKMTASSTAVSGVLTLLPEILAWQTARRERRRILQQSSSGAAAEKCSGSSTNDEDVAASSKTMQLQFQLPTMGCAS